MDKICHECEYIIKGKSYLLKEEDTGLEYWICENCMEKAYMK
jgi:hypothetical protein